MGYLSGAGQLCRKCAEKNMAEERIAMQNGFIYDIPYCKKERR